MTESWWKVPTPALGAVAGLLIFCGAGLTEELSPDAGRSVALNAARGTIYYSLDGDDFVVVATMDIDGRPMRFVTSLRSGQKTKISTPGGPGEAETAIEFRRDGDRMFVVEHPDQRQTAAEHADRRVILGY